jgi:hypothetical protein
MSNSELTFALFKLCTVDLTTVNDFIG